MKVTRKIACLLFSASAFTISEPIFSLAKKPPQAEKPAASYSGLEVFGWVERVKLYPIDQKVKAKLDTGAKTSSLDARNIRVVRQGKNRYVRFEFVDPDTKEVTEMRLRRIRGVRIVRHSGQHQHRHVAELDICLGEHRKTIEVSLIDRSNFIYPLLLGRRALENIALIDSGSTFLNAPRCPDLSSQSPSTEPEVLEDPDKLDYQDEPEDESKH